MLRNLSDSSCGNSGHQAACLGPVLTPASQKFDALHPKCAPLCKAMRDGGSVFHSLHDTSLVSRSSDV